MSLERDAVQDFFGWIFNILGYVTGTMVLFQISTIDPSMVFTPRPWSDWVQMSNPTFQGLDVFFWDMLAEHSCRWFDEADCMVRIVAQMLRVLIWWSISPRKQGCGWLEHKSFGKILVVTVSVSSRWPSATRLSLFVQHLLWGGQRSRDGFAERETSWVPMMEHWGNGLCCHCTLSWGRIDLEKNQEAMLFVTYISFAGGGWFGKIWNLRAHSFESNVVWDGLSCAGGAHTTRCVGFGIRWKVREIFSDSYGS